MSKTKINMIGGKGVFIKYIVKVLLLSVVTVLIFSALSALIILKMDFSLDYSKYFSIAIVSFASIIISYFSVSSFSNNGTVLGIISVLPLCIYSVINNIVHTNDWIILMIKLLLMIILGAFFGYYSIKNKKKIRVR